METPTVHDRNADQMAYWNGPGGRRWLERQQMQDLLLAPVSECLFERAGVAPGERALDIGCGCGGTTIELGRRVGSGGHVLGLDISAPMLDRARELAPPGSPVEFALADATVYAFEPGSRDLLFSRFGVMFFADPAVSFANMRKALRVQGRLAVACWQEPRRNPWMMLPLQAAYKHAPRLPEMGPEDPGPFSFARAERVQRILGEAGFIWVSMQPVELVLDLAGGQGLEAAVKCALEIGPVSRVLDDQPPDLLAKVADSIRAALAPVQQGDTVPLGGSIWIVTAVSP